MFTISRQKHGVDTKNTAIMFTVHEQKSKKNLENIAIKWYNNIVKGGVYHP